MYVNDEPLVFSETFVSVIRALLRIVWWSVGFTVVFCVQPAGCPRATQPHPRTCGHEIIHTRVLENYSKGSTYYIMYVGSAATDSISRNERQVAKYFSVFLSLSSILWPRTSSAGPSANSGEGRMIYETRTRPHTNAKSRRSWKMNHILYCLYIALLKSGTARREIWIGNYSRCNMTQYWPSEKWDLLEKKKYKYDIINCYMRASVYNCACV